MCLKQVDRRPEVDPLSGAVSDDERSTGPSDADQARGRLVWSEDSERGVPYDVVIDGRKLSWEEFGEALASYEGWNFSLVIEDRTAEAEIDGGAGGADATDIPIDRRR